MTANARGRLAGLLAGRLAQRAGDRQITTTVACAGPRLTVFPAAGGGRSTRLAQALLGAFLLTLAFAAFAPQADAQGYSVDFNCERADGWGPGSSNENFAAWRDCAGGWLSGMKTYVVPHNDGRTSTGSAYHSFTAPSGTRISGLDWEGNKFYGFTSAGFFGGGWAFKTALLGDNFREIDRNAYCYTDNFGECFSGDSVSGN